MSIDNFIPEVWSSRILETFDRAHVYAKVCNRDYEGDIKDFGDTVRINSVGDPTITAYTKNSDIAAVEELEDSQMTLVIDKANYFNFAVDDIDKRQQQPKGVMAEAVQRASFKLSDSADTDLAAVISAGVATANVKTAITSGFAPEDAYDLIVDLWVLLMENDVPDESLWVVVPPRFKGYLKKDDRFVSFGTDANRNAAIRGDAFGEVNGMKVYTSNNVPVSSTAYDILAGHMSAVSYAEQILKTKAYEPERRFSDALKGLHVYGRKVVRPYALAKCVVTMP